MIGKKIVKPVKTWTDYAMTAAWCNQNNAVIKDNGDHYVVAPIDKTPEELAQETMAKAKADRAEAVARITVEVDGMIFDGDETAQDRMTRAITMYTSSGLPPDTTTEWVLADNTVANVTVNQLAQALLLAGQNQTELWTKPYEQTT